MPSKERLRVAFLLGSDSPSSRLCVEQICGIAEVQPVVALLDTLRVGLGRRLKNLRNNTRKEGWRYAPRRILEALRSATDRLVEQAPISKQEVSALLAKAFPERCFSLGELARKYNFAVAEVGSLNSPEAVRALQEAEVDLGIVLGTRILKEPIFSVPRLGCINLHKGKVPEYRGMPPGFWELYDGAKSAGVTVHFVDKGLDTGDVLAISELPISPRDTPETLLERLHQEGARTLVGVVKAIQAGTAVRQKQSHTTAKAKSKPTLADVEKLQRVLPFWTRQSDLQILAKNLYSLLVYYSGLYALVRRWHRRSPARACILLHHRVNDYAKDPLTVDLRTFAAQLLAMAKHYSGISTTELVGRIRTHKKIQPTSIAIHFDDCYRDIFQNGAPILNAVGWPATAFISSGFVDTDRSFAHDVEKYAFRFPNLRSEDIRRWVDSGLEIGVHTVNHVDLGTCRVEDLPFEILDSRAQLAAVLNRTAPPAKSVEPSEIGFFSFPFGRIDNIRAEAVEVIRKAGYSALFSAHGGFVGARTDLYDVPRMGCSGSHRPLYLLLEIEELSLSQIAQRLRTLLSLGKNAPRDFSTDSPGKAN